MRIALLLFPLALAAAATAPQNPAPKDQPPPQQTQPSQPRQTPKTPAAKETFVPSEQVSADAEVDFPGDI